MVERRRIEAEVTPTPPAVLARPTLDQDGVMLVLANEMRYDVRARLQAVAGDELMVVEKAHCPACYAPM